MNASFEIGDTDIGAGHRCFVVAEMSGNHGQRYERALAIVRAAAEAGADAVKMQAYTADTITLEHDGPDFRIASDNSWSSFGTLHALYREAYTPWEWFEPLTREAKRLGMEAFCSVFDDTSVALMESIGTSAYKIAAQEITDVPLLRTVARTGKPVILSSGVASRDDLELAVETLRDAGCERLVVLKCTSEYPAPVEQANLRTMAHMRETFGCLSGLSDHTAGTAVPIAAVSLGAAMIEKHFTLDEAETVDSFFSLRPAEFRHMVEQIRLAEKALGTVDYRVAGEKSGTADGRRSLYACRPIRSGERFSVENVKSVRPFHGLHPRHHDALIGQVARRDIAFGDRLTIEDLNGGESDTARQILALFVEAGADGCASAGLDYRLLDDGALDSFSRISLCMELESHFGVTLSSRELLEERHRSVAGLARLVDERRAAASAADDHEMTGAVGDEVGDEAGDRDAA